MATCTDATDARLGGRAVADHPPWHAISAEAALAASGVDDRLGLDAAEVTARQARHGPNALPEPPPRPPWRTLARQFASPPIAILGVSAVLALGLGHTTDAAVVVAVLVVNALVGVRAPAVLIVGLAMRPQGRVLRVTSWISLGLIAAYAINAALVALSEA